MKYIWIIIALLAALATWFLFANRTPTIEVKEEQGVQITNAVLSDYNGNVLAVNSIEGLVVINLWATWCPFCTEELPDFAEIQKEFAGRVTIVAVNRQESLEVAKNYTETLGITDELIFALDKNDTIYKEVGGIGMPLTLIYDENKNEFFRKSGPLSKEEFRVKLNELLSNN